MRFVLGATLLGMLTAPATADSPLDWVPPPEAAQWAPGTTENLAMVLMPGLTGQQLESAQFEVAVDMTMLIAVVGRAEASIVQRRWEHRLNAIRGTRDEKLDRWRISPSAIEGFFRTTGKLPTAMTMIGIFIVTREKLENETGTNLKIAESRRLLRHLSEDTRDIFGEAASNAILTRDMKYQDELRQTIVDGGFAVARSRAKRESK